MLIPNIELLEFMVKDHKSQEQLEIMLLYVRVALIYAGNLKHKSKTLKTIQNSFNV